MSLELIPHVVMVFGTFDVFHPGHRFFIEQATKKVKSKKNKSEKGGKGTLLIVIARDKTVRAIKPVLRNDEKARQSVVQEHFPEVQVVLGDEEDPMQVIREHRPALVCLGYDQIGFSKKLQEEYPEVRIERIEAFFPEKYKSSLMGREGV
jgi:cytidyltransferase-like protein